MTRRAIVVGGGIVGICCALALQERGINVSLVEMEKPGQKASRWNAGVLATSSAMILANPGTRANLPKLLMGRVPGFRMHPHSLLGFLPWGLKFLKACSPANFETASVAMASLIGHSVRVHERYLARVSSDGLLRHKGWLWLYRTKRAVEHSKYQQLNFRRLGVEHQSVDGDGVANLEPELRERFEGGLFFPETKSVSDPFLMVETYLNLFLKHGGTLIEGEASDISGDAKQPSVFIKNHGALSADHIVIAAGPWTKGLLAKSRTKYPSVCERGYVRQFEFAAKASLTRPIFDAENGLVLSPRPHGVQLSTGTELGHIGNPPRQTQIDAAAKAASSMLDIKPVRGSETMYADRPTLPDCLPAIGAAGMGQGVWLCSGHQHVGFSTAAGSADILAALVTGERLPIDIKPFDPRRF